MAQIFPIDFDEKLTIANWDFILFSDSEDGNKIKKAQYSNLKWEQGDPGTPGADGAAATITVGSVSTLPAGSSATVTNSWTTSAAVLDFGIPEWATWTPGTDWEDGAAATITVWTTTTLPAWSSATVTNVWTSKDAIFNFWIPKWDSWSGSWDVNWPASSTDWDVVIFDWSTWKLIKDGSVALSTLSSWASLAATAIQPWDDISDLNNDSGFITWITSLDVTTALGYTPYDSSNPAGYLTSSTWVTSFNWSSWAITYTAPVSSVNSQTWAVTLDADDISDSTTTNKFVTASDKITWGNKQDALTLPATPTQWNIVTWGASNKTLVDWWTPVVSGDSWIIYTIKVSNSDPSGASSTTITLVP